MGTFNGLPLHPLVVHAVVVLVPLTVLLAIVFAVVPKLRWLLRWPLLAAALVSVVVTFVAKQSGLRLEPTFANSPLVKIHADRANLLVILVYVFAAICLVAVFTLGGTSQLASGALARKPVGGKAVQVVVAVALVAMSLVVAVQVARTGDAGARAAWNGTKVE
jgi:hypothetical protein